MRAVGAFVFCAAIAFSLFAAAAPLPDSPSVSQTAGNNAAGTPPDDPPGLADRNADALSDSLASRIQASAPGDRFDVVVTFSAPGWDSAGAQQQVGTFRVNREFRTIRGFAATMTAAQIGALAANPAIHRIEEDFEVTVKINEATEDFGSNRARIDFALDGSGTALARPVGICVIDTGINAQHEQLDNGKVVGFFDAVNGLTIAYDDHGHGTHVASIAAGDGVGGVAAASHRGVAPGAALYGAKALDAQGSGTSSQIVAAIDWCLAQSGVDILSMSLGTAEGSDGQDSLSVAANCAADPNWSTVCSSPSAQPRIVVVAAGNAGPASETVGSPGAAEKVITVGAVANPSGDGRGVYLSAFSSRGPTLDGRVKPDITAPGVRIAAADYLVSTGYVNKSGTSMAAPFVSGVVALMVDANPDLRLPDPVTGDLPVDRVRELLAATAQDRGPDGPNNDTKDNEYGLGLLDAYAAVARASGLASGQHDTTRFPRYFRVQGSVAANGAWLSDPIYVAGDGTPIAAVLTIDGALACSLGSPGLCKIFGFGWVWDPDLDMELVDAATGVQVPAGSGNITRSECPLAGEYCGASRQETVYFLPPGSGSYRIRVYAFDTGGSFALEVSGLDIGLNADAGPDQTVYDSDNDGIETVTLDGSASSHNGGGTIVAYEWKENGTSIATGATPPVGLGVGTHNIVLTVTDDAGNTETDTVVVDLRANHAPVADAGPDRSVIDGDGDGVAPVTLDAGGSSDPDGGGIVSYQWSEAGVMIATGATPTLGLAIGSHELVLTVTDTGGAAATDAVVVTVQANQPPVAVAGPDQTVSDADGDGVEVVTLDGSASVDPGGAIVSYAWSRDGLLVATGPTMNLSLAPGDHDFTLTVADEAGAIAFDSVRVTVLANQPPVAVAGPDVFLTDFDGGGDETVTLFAGASSDPEGGALSFVWTEAGVIVGSGESLVVTRVVGTHEFILTVTDNAGAGTSDAVTVTVNPDPHAKRTVLLAHLDGPNGATTASDDSGRGHALSFAGTARIDTAESRFGGASLLLDGAGTTFVSAADSDDWHFGAGEFTVEAWVRFGSLDSYSALINASDFGADQISWLLDWTSTGLIRFLYSPDGTNAKHVTLTAPWTPTLGAWHHVAVDRDANANLRIYVDGKVLLNKVVTTAFHNATAQLRVGELFTGWIDEVRVTKGVARYQGAFSNPRTPVTSDDIVLLTHLDGPDGATTASDDSGRGHALSFAGTARIDTAESRFGGASLVLDGAGTTFVSAADSDDWHFGAGEFTVEAWVRFGSLDSYSALINASDFGADQISWLLDWTSTGLLRFLYSPDGTNAKHVTLAAPWTPTVGAWHHVAVDRDANANLRIYVDGKVLLNKVVTTAFHNATAQLRVGELFTGWIDEVRVTKGAAQYAGTFTPVGKTPGFTDVVLLSHLDGLDGATAANDESNSGHALSFAGAAQIDTAQSRFGGASLLLDGAGTTFVSAADSDDWHFAADEFTVEAWVRFGSLDSYSALINTSNYGADQISWLLDWTSTGLIRFLYSPDGTKAQHVTLAAPWTPTLGAWHHVAVDRDAGKWLRIYVDGEPLLEAYIPTAFHNATAQLRVGELFAGWVDEVRVTKGVALYGGWFVPPTEPFPVAQTTN